MVTNNLTESLKLVETVIRNSNGNSDHFGETLRHERIPHLSFSQVSTVEFCQRRYFLEYIELTDPFPTPDYFTKGKLLHQIIASSYARLASNQPFNISEIFEEIDIHYNGRDPHHIKNGVKVHLQNLWQGYDVVAIEEPFAFIIDDTLPPCVGIIDLILKRGDTWVLVDHKTGRDFYPYDELQMAIYLKYIEHRFNAGECSFYYDHYRWVNNLDRIRKPAFKRTPMFISEDYWDNALKRIRNGYEQMQTIRLKDKGRKNGECFRCPYRYQC